MTKNDQKLIAEAYKQVNEGLFDRLKARGSQAVGAVKGAGQQLAGKAQKAAGSAVAAAGNLASKGASAVGIENDPEKNKLFQKGAQMQKDGAKAQTQGQRAGQEAKYKSYITNSVKTITNDLAKLGMPVKDEDALMKDLQATLTKHLTQVGGKSGKQLRDASGKLGGAIV